MPQNRKSHKFQFEKLFSIKIIIILFMIFYLLVFLLVTLSITQINLILNGDFQLYNTNISSSGSLNNQELYLYIDPSIDRWKRKPLNHLSTLGSGIEVKKITNPPWPTNSKVADMVSFQQYGICQNVSLINNQLYNINYNLILDACILESTISFTINSDIIAQKNYNKTNLIYSQSINFKANAIWNYICLEPTYIKYNSSTIFMFKFIENNFGPVIDNISLFLIPRNLTNNTFSNNNNSTINVIQNISNNSSNNTSVQNSSENTSQPIPIIPQIPFSSTTKITTIYINFVSNFQQFSEKIKIVSDFKPALYGIPLQFFEKTKIQIMEQTQINIKYSVDQDGYLSLQFYPESYFDEVSIANSLTIYIPQLPLQANSFKFIAKVDGKTIKLVSLTESERKFIQSTTSVIEKITKIIHKSFLVINSVSCSYFIINLIGFYNLTLMYIFLALTTLPNFGRIFLNTLAYIFFTKGSLIAMIMDLFKIEGEINFLNFPIRQKIMEDKDLFLWFGTFGSSSNFMKNNFQALILLSLLFLKVGLFKIMIKILPQKWKTLFDVKPFKFFEHFLGQLSCFVPFFIVSSVECILNMGENGWIGQLNNSVQILSFFLFCWLTFIGFSLKYSIYNKRISNLHKQKNKSQVIKKFKKLVKIRNVIFEKYSYLSLCYLIPFTVALGSKVLFFIVTTPIIVWRFYISIKTMRHQKSIRNTFNLVNKIIWFVYHFAFLLNYFIEILGVDGNSTTLVNMMKYTGFVVIFCVLMGAGLDILELVYSLGKALIIFLKKVYLNNQIKIQQKDSRLNKQKQNKGKHIIKINVIKKLQNNEGKLTKIEENKQSQEQQKINKTSKKVNNATEKTFVSHKSRSHIKGQKKINQNVLNINQNIIGQQ